MKWAEISIQTSHEATEAVAEIFHELGASGVLIEDPELVNNYIHSGAWDYTDIPLAEEIKFTNNLFILLSLLVNNLISSPGLECTRHSQAYIYSFLIIIQYHLFPVFVRFAA